MFGNKGLFTAVAKNNNRRGLIHAAASIYVVILYVPKEINLWGLYGLSYKETYLCREQF